MFLTVAFFSQFLIHLHQSCHCLRWAVPFRRMLRGRLHEKAIGLHHCHIISNVCFPQLRWHSQLIIQISQATIRVQCPCIQYSLSRSFYFLLLCLCRITPRKVVINNSIGILITRSIIQRAVLATDAAKSLISMP